MNKAVTKRSGITQFLVVMASLVVVIAGMRASQGILVQFLLAVFLAVVLTPLLYWLKRKGVPTGLAVTILIILIVLIGLVFAALIGTSVNDFIRSLPEYQTRLRESSGDAIAWANQHGVDLPRKVIMQYVDPGAAMSLAASILTELGGVLTNVLLILFAVIFMLLEASGFPDKIREAFGDPRAQLPNITKFTNSVEQYMLIKTVVSFGTGVIVTVMLAIVGVDYPILWGVLAFLLNYVPNFGSIIAAVPAVLLAILQLGFGSAVVVAVGYVIINVVVGNVIEPRIMGKGLGLSTLIVFLSLVFWGWVLGPVGMLLSVPLTITVKIALETMDDTKWIAILLGPSP